MTELKIGDTYYRELNESIEDFYKRMSRFKKQVELSCERQVEIRFGYKGRTAELFWRIQ